ncbi:MAG: type VI secretion system protein ImpL, partial [Deltaproteobacteria bacterium]|nr:type VI secretion system protein ImpL [Deltaproteobacteria bacterium]
MKQIFLKLLKLALIIAVLLLGIVLAIGIILTLDWPWWVGFFILAGSLGLLLGIIFLRKVWGRRREQRFVQQVIEQDDARLRTLGGKEKERSKELQDRWKEAMEALRRSHLKKLGNPLYVLPWYMVIGESGSGKTTAIESARLSSPFAEFTRTSGVSGTPNCDWWFFEQAIIIDTAGRYA